MPRTNIRPKRGKLGGVGGKKFYFFSRDWFLDSGDRYSFPISPPHHLSEIVAAKFVVNLPQLVIIL
ncbi:hypothetical protein H6F61_01515 [Cyanobacteria bacterium FACHB-472]|nr:hypothetical protein [Cyanobacteria bacterium FACHB-472]